MTPDIAQTRSRLESGNLTLKDKVGKCLQGLLLDGDHPYIVRYLLDMQIGIGIASDCEEFAEKQAEVICTRLHSWFGLSFEPVINFTSDGGASNTYLLFTRVDAQFPDTPVDVSTFDTEGLYQWRYTTPPIPGLYRSVLAGCEKADQIRWRVWDGWAWRARGFAAPPVWDTEFDNLEETFLPHAWHIGR